MTGKKLIKNISTVILLMFLSLSILPTVCFFSTRAKATTTVMAATTEEIITYNIEKTNPKEITINKSEKININPIIYFGVEGEAKKYILHINPIKLDSYGDYKIPINLNVNLQHYIELYADNTEKDIYCSIQVKYLNGFINEKTTIQFTKEYIMNTFIETLGAEEKNILKKFLKESDKEKKKDQPEQPAVKTEEPLNEDISPQKAGNL